MSNIIFVLFPVNLFKDISLLKKSHVFLVEEEYYFDRNKKEFGNLKFNMLKPIYHRATMKSYYDYLLHNNIQCEYINLNVNWIRIVKKYINNLDATMYIYEPNDHYIGNLIMNNFDNYVIVDSPNFILTSSDIDKYNGALRQTSFYKWVREKTNILNDVLIIGLINTPNTGVCQNLYVVNILFLTHYSIIIFFELINLNCIRMNF